MTRKIGKSAKLSAIVVLLVLMSVGIGDVFAEDQAQLDLHEFDQFLAGVAAEILSLQHKIMPVTDTSNTIHTEYIIHQIKYLEAFEEVIHRSL